MTKLSKGEKKLINLALVVTAGIVFFLIFLYFPKTRSLSQLKLKVDRSSQLLSEIRTMIGDYATLEHGIGVLRKKANFLNAKFIYQKDIAFALRQLNDTADNVGIRIISLTPQPLTSFGGKDVVKYNDKSCLWQPVKLVIEGRYEQLAQYMYLLEQSPAGIYTINNFSIRKDESIFPDVNVDLTVGVYVFGEERTVR